MSIAHYLKEIGRGKQGARSLSREQAADLFGQLLDGAVTDLEVGAFCLAMRIKGETPHEMAGFLDATHARLARVPVVFMTARGGASDLERYRVAGSLGSIVKPFDPMTLAERLRGLLRDAP